MTSARVSHGYDKEERAPMTTPLLHHASIRRVEHPRTDEPTRTKEHDTAAGRLVRPMTIATRGRVVCDTAGTFVGNEQCARRALLRHDEECDR